MHKIRLIALIAMMTMLPVGSYAMVKLTKTVLQSFVLPVNKLHKINCYADSCDHLIGIPYVENGNERQVLDIYYARENRKNAVLIEIHGGFYVAGKRQNHRPFASVFLEAGYDVVLVEYRLVGGDTIDVSDQLRDCAAAVDFIATHADKLGLNKHCMFLTGSSAGGHLALYTAEGSQDKSMPIHSEHFHTKGVLINCPAYDFASFNATGYFYPSAMKWFLGPRYMDQEWMNSMSPRTFLSSYKGPLFVSSSREDFLLGQTELIVADCDSLHRKIDYVYIDSKRKKAGHVHNVSNPSLKESKEVNNAMLLFMEKNKK